MTGCINPAVASYNGPGDDLASVDVVVHPRFLLKAIGTLAGLTFVYKELQVMQLFHMMICMVLGGFKLPSQPHIQPGGSG